MKRFRYKPGFTVHGVSLVAGCMAAMLFSAGTVSAQQRPTRRAARTVGNVEVCAHLADRLLSATGFTDSLNGAMQISRMQFQTGLNGIHDLTEAERKQINQGFGRAFDPARLRASVRAHLVLRCDEGTYKSVLRSLGSPLAQKMHRLEEQAGTAAGAAALKRYFDKMSLNPPSSERMAAVRRLAKSRHELQFLQRLLFVTAREIAVGFGNPPPSRAKVRDAMQTYLPMANRMILIRELAVYRDVPDRDLYRYAAMWESAPFQRFDSILAESSVAAFGSGVREAAQAVRPFLGKAPTRRNP